MVVPLTEMGKTCERRRYGVYIRLGIKNLLNVGDSAQHLL